MKKHKKTLLLLGAALLVLVAGYIAFNKWQKSKSVKKAASIGANFTMQESDSESDTVAATTLPTASTTPIGVTAPVTSAVG